MDILTYNIYCPFLGPSSYDERIDKIVSDILEYNLTVVFLQEVFIFSLFGYKIFGKDNLLEEKLRNIGFNYFLKSSEVYFFQNPGLFVASKYPIRLVNEVIYPQKKCREMFTTKGALIFQIDNEKWKNITWVNTHLHCMSEYDDIRMEQLNQIKQQLELKNINNDIFLIGDLNIDSINQQKYYLQIMSLFENGIDVYKNEHYHPVTSPPDERLDYIIYYGKNIEFIGNKLVISDASDHYGVIGKIRLSS
jgi:endonuclease/exonuclease/phosphatase family metal-dependent hydrolase